MTEPANASATTPEPVVANTAVIAAIGTILAVLWGTNDEIVLNIVASVVGGLITLGATFYTRSKVTPTSKPRNDEGEKLTPEVF